MVLFADYGGNFPRNSLERPFKGEINSFDFCDWSLDYTMYTGLLKMRTHMSHAACVTNFGESPHFWAKSYFSRRQKSRF